MTPQNKRKERSTSSCVGGPGHRHQHHTKGSAVAEKGKKKNNKELRKRKKGIGFRKRKKIGGKRLRSLT